MSKVELIFDSDCPNVEPVREELRRAFSQIGESPDWVEWLRTDPKSPGRVRRCGSPTILVDGKDIDDSDLGGVICCRVYQHPDGSFRGVPPLKMIVAALSASAPQRLRLFSILPAIAVAFVPKLVCPACWPAYAALISAMGLGFLITARNLLVVSIGFLTLAVISLFIQGKKTNNYKPLWLAFMSAAMILVGKFVLNVVTLVYAGAVLLIIAAFFEAIFKKKASGCPTCKTRQTRKSYRSRSRDTST